MATLRPVPSPLNVPVPSARTGNEGATQPTPKLLRPARNATASPPKLTAGTSSSSGGSSGVAAADARSMTFRRAAAGSAHSLAVTANGQVRTSGTSDPLLEADSYEWLRVAQSYCVKLTVMNG